MGNTSISVYKTWAKSRDLSDDMLGRIYSKANSSGDVELLALIASRDKLPEHIENLIVSRNELDVIKAWVNKNLGNTDKIVKKVLADKRATLLLLMSGLRNLPEDLYKAFATSSSKKVAQSLALNSSVSDELILSIDDLVISSISGEHSGTVNNTQNLLKARPFLMEKFVRNVKSNTALVTALSSFEISEEISEVGCSRLANLELDDRNYTFLNLFEKFLSKELSANALNALKPLAERETSSYDYYGRRIVEVATIALSRVGFDTVALYTRLKECAGAELALVIKEAKQAIADKKVSSSTVSKSIWENENSSNAVLIDFLYHAPKETVLQKMLKLEASGELDRVVSLFDERLYSTLSVDLLADPLLVIEFAASRPGDVPNWVRSSKVWERDKSLALKYQTAVTALTDRNSCEVAKEYVSSQHFSDTQWETFDGLVAEFSGSIHELVAAVKALNN